VSAVSTIPWLPTTSAQEMPEPNLAEQVAMMLRAERQVVIVITGRDSGRVSGFLADLTHALSHGDSVLRIKTGIDVAELFVLLAGQLGLPTQNLSPMQVATKVGERLGEAAPSGHFILVCENAQLFSEALLESIRQLSNYPINIVLCGRPMLLRRLGRPALSAFKQRLNYRLNLDESTFTGAFKWLLALLIFGGLAYFGMRWLAETPAPKNDVHTPFPSVAPLTQRAPMPAIILAAPTSADDSAPSLILDKSLRQPPAKQ
jgi:hypothetical protein